MRYARKILSFILAAAMTVSLAPLVSFAETEETSARPSISNPATDENYTGGIDAIDWGGADWGKFASVDWTDAAEMSAADLAAKLNESGVNALAFEDELTYENGVLSVGDTPIQEADLGGITLDGNTVTFPKGDTALIIPTDNFGALEVNNETVFDIPDDSNVAVIAVAKDGSQPRLNYTIWGYDPFTVNTNKNGNLAVVNLIASDYSSQGILINNELNIGGTGTVAIVGGKSGSSSIGINAKSVNVSGASLIATADFSMGTSRGIYTARPDDPDEYTGNITADNGALIISVGGGALSGSVGIETINISAKNGSEIYAYGGTVPDDDGDSKNDMRTIGLQIMAGTAKRTITADNDSKIYASAGNGAYQYGILEEDGPVSIIVDGDTSNIRAWGRDGAVKLRDEPMGSYIAKCGCQDDEFSFDKEKGIYVGANGLAVSELQFTAAPAADYGIYYDTESGFRKNTKDGEALDPLPYGISADGNTLILDNIEFKTTYETALTVGEGVTVNVPKDSVPIIMTASSAKDKIADGIVMLGGNTLNVDGDLSVDVSGSDADNYAIRSKDLTISGAGIIETSGGSDALDTPSAIYSSGNLTVGDEISIVTGGLKMDDLSETALTIKDNATVGVKDDNYSNIGVTVKKMLVEGSAVFVVVNGVVTVAGDKENPGEIRLRENGSIFAYHSGGAALLGCYDSSYPELSAGNTPIIVEDNAYVSVSGSPAALHAKAADGVKVVGGAKSSDDYELQYDDEKFTYINPQTGEAAEYVKFAKRDTVDYPLYFDGETGKLYKTFDYVFATGEITYSDPIEVPGAKCEGNKLTLTSDFQFYTNHEDGLYLGEGTTLYVPEGESPSVYGAASGLTMSDDDSIGGSSGIYCFGDNTLNIDGNLKVTAGGGTNISSWGILSADKDKVVNITGKGSLTTLGGNVVYDETIESSRGDSAGIVSYGDLNISIAELNAIGGESYTCSVGIDADYPMIEPHTITINGGAKVNAKGGVCAGGENNASNGCAANHVIIKDHSSLTASASAATDSFGLMIFDWESYGDGKIELSGGSSLDSTALNSTYGCGVISRSNKPVIVKMDKGCTFTAEGAKIASVPELAGVTAMSDGKTVKYDSEKSGYIDADGNFVKKLSFEPLETVSTTHRGSRGGSSRPKATASPQPTASSDPSATENPSAATEPTSEPQSTAKPNDTAAAVPFTDVAETDWFYNAVKAVYEEGIMNGVSDTEFAPDMPITRGMLVTIVGRMGAAESASNTSFADVSADAYYAPYVAWAAENGIVTGFDNGTFRPDETVTREQTAAILYRYMNYIGADVSVGENTNILSYADANEISEYAVLAIQWACGAGIINGYPDGSLAPKNNITRAESAAMISAVSLL